MYLLLLFIVLPAVELFLLIEVGSAIGALPTVGIIVATGVMGATLARHQGLAVLSRLRREVDSGRLPADALVDGVLILLAGALLVTPGVLTDAAGLLLLIPATRSVVKRYLKRRFEQAVRPGRGVVIDQDDVR